jgi:hypothetical protein
MVVNIYGTYGEIISYWENLIRDVELEESNLITRGDLNLTISLREVWGANARHDVLSDFFIHLF